MNIFHFILHLLITVTRAIANGYLSLKSGESNIIVAGGQESMSQAQHTIYLRNGIKMGDCNFIDTLIHDGLTDAFTSIHMGVTGESKVSK